MSLTKRTSTLTCPLALTPLLIALALNVRAADRTWDGGGINANWSAVANWDGDVTSPTTNDVLYFSGSAKLANTNDLLADTSFAGLTFNSGAGAFTLLGNRITLGGNVTNWSASTQTLNLPVVLSGTRDFNATNGNMTVNGVLSGSGSLTKTGSQTLILAGNNTYDGVTTNWSGGIQVSYSNALGSTVGGTVINTAGAPGAFLSFYGGITLAEPLTFIGGSVNTGCIINGGGTNTVSGMITTSGGRYVANAGVLNITGGVTGTGANPFFVVNAQSTIAFTTTPLNLGPGTFHADSGGLTILGVAGNQWTNMLFSGGTLRLDVTNALPATTELKMGGVWYGPNCTMNLNGFDQTIASIMRAEPTPGTIAITSAVPATLTVNQSINTTYDGQLMGAVGLIKAGTGSLSLSNALNSSSGSITVSNGTLVVTAGSSLGNSTNILVAGGTLELQNGTALKDNATVLISGSGKLKIGTGFTETVSRLFLNGSQGLKGTYGSSVSTATYTNDAFFSGSGLLNVLSIPPIIPTNYTWTAGGVADTYLNTATNWAGGVAPALGGTSQVIFGTGGSTATVNTNASLYGITFNRDGNFTVANGDGAVTLGLGGIAATAPTPTSRSYTLAEDVTLIENQTWGTYTNLFGYTTLTVSGNIGDGTNVCGITKLGEGKLILSGTNSYDGVTTNWSGVLNITQSNALGSAVGGTVINTAYPGNSAKLELPGGITLAEPLTFIGGSNNGWCLHNMAGTNILTGLMNTTGGRYYISGGTTLIVEGGITNNPFLVINGSGTLIVRKTPLRMGTGTFYADDYSLTIIDVASNQWGELTIAKGIVRMNQKDVLAPAATLRMGLGYGPSGTLDLNGFDQTTTRLYNGTTGAGACIVTSGPPATLTINQSLASSTYEGQLTGAVGLFKTGTGTLTLTNAANTTLATSRSATACWW